VVDSSPPDRRRHGLIPRLARALRGLAQKLDPEVDPTRRAHERANLAESRLRTAIEALPEGVVFLDAEGRYVLWNQRYAEIYHRSADLFAPGKKLADTLAVGVARGDYPDAIGREEAWLAERLARMGNPGHRHEQFLADGRWILIEERRMPDGGLIGLPPWMLDRLPVHSWTVPGLALVLCNGVAPMVTAVLPAVPREAATSSASTRPKEATVRPVRPSITCLGRRSPWRTSRPWA